MKKNIRRVLAYVLALALIFSNFVGFNITAKAADETLSKVSIEKDQRVAAKNGVVKATVEGSNLTKLYYQLQEYRYVAEYDRMMWQVATDKNEVEIVSPSESGGEINIPVPENKGTEERRLRIAIHCKQGLAYNSNERVEFKQEAGDGSGATVDKSELNAMIAKAAKYVKEEYTEESWEKMQTALTEAKKVAGDSNATDASVKAATDKLQQAIDDLQAVNADSMTVRVKVADKSGNPVKGVEFTFKPLNEVNKEPVVPASDENGETTFSLEGCVGIYKLEAVENDNYTFNPKNGYSIGIDPGTNEVDGNSGVLTFMAVEKGDEDKPQESASINIKTVDKSGKPIQGVEFTLVNPFVGGNVEVSPSDAKGESVISVGKLYGKYVLKANDTTEYTFTPEKGYEFMVMDGKFVGENVTTKNVVFTGLKAGEKPDTEVDKDKLKAKIEEASKIDGGLYTEESYKKLTDALAEAKKVYEQADAKQDAVDAQVAKLEEALKGLQEIPQDLTKMNIKVVDEAGSPVSGVAFTFVNNNVTPPHELSVSPTNGNGETVVSVAACNGLYMVKAVNTAKYTFSPENGYSVIIAKGQLNAKDCRITFTAKEKGDPGEPDVPQGDVQVTRLTSDLQGNIPKSGATVKLSVEGKNLTASNWSAEAVAYIEGTDLEASWMGKVEASKVSATGAELVIPSNPKTNRYEWRVIAGPLKDGNIEKHQQLLLAQEGKKSAERVEIKQAVLKDEHTLEVTFAKEIKIADEVANDETALKKMFLIEGRVTFGSDDKPNGAEDYYLKEKDKITVEGTELTITFDEEITLNNGRFVFEEGCLALADGSKNLQALKWVILSGANVTGVEIEKDLFDNKGGKVVAKLQGVNLASLQEDQIEATITNPVTREPVDLETVIATGDEPTISFTVPENTTKVTQSYLLSVKANDKPVYPGTNIRGNRIIISVLAKGVDITAQTVSSMTISGNNELDQEQADQSQVTVYAVPGDEGSLKTAVRLTGTNLNSKLTELRAIDENGVIFPVSHVPE